MDEHTLDHTVLLGQFRKLHKPRIWIIVIGLKHALHPSRSTVCDIISDAVRKECLDMASSDSDIDDSHPDIFRKSLGQCPSEIVSRSKSCVLTAERRHSRVPLPLDASPFLIVDRCHHHETVAHPFKILLLDTGVSFHIRLAEAQIDMEIRILGLCCKHAQKSTCRENDSFHMCLVYQFIHFSTSTSVNIGALVTSVGTSLPRRKRSTNASSSGH